MTKLDATRELTKNQKMVEGELKNLRDLAKSCKVSDSVNPETNLKNILSAIYISDQNKNRAIEYYGNMKKYFGKNEALNSYLN